MSQPGAENRRHFNTGIGRLSKALALVILVGLAVYALLYCRLAVSLIAYPFDWEESDGNVIVCVKLLEHGRSFYSDPSRYPMLPYVYPPAYPFVVFAATRLLGDHVGVARLVSFISTAVICILIYRIVRREGVVAVGAKAPRVIALMAAMMMFPFADGMYWMASAKPDAFFMMLLLLGFWGLSRCCEPTASGAWLVLAWAAFLAAIFTKHAGLPAAALAAIYLSLANWRRGLLFTLSLSAVSAGLAIAIQYWSQGWFYNDVYRFASDFAANVGFDFSRSTAFIELLAAMLVPLAVALVTAFVGIAHRKHLVWVVLFAAGIVWSVQVLRTGLGENHMVPCAVAGSILFGIGATRWHAWAARSGSSAAKWGTLALTVLLLLQLIAPLRELRLYRPPDAQNRKAMQRICAWGREADGPVLVDYMPSVAITLGTWEHAVDSCNLSFCKTANEDQILADVRERRFAEIILFQSTFLRPEVTAEILRAYRFADVIDVPAVGGTRKVVVCVPK